MEFVSIILGILIAALLSGFVIWIVGKLGLGLMVSSFGAAFIAAIIIAVISGLITWLLGVLGITIGGGFLGVLVHLIIAAIVLMISSRIVKGMMVQGFVGALIAAVAIGVVSWLVTAILGIFELG